MEVRCITATCEVSEQVKVTDNQYLFIYLTCSIIYILKPQRDKSTRKDILKLFLYVKMVQKIGIMNLISHFYKCTNNGRTTTKQ